MRDNTPVTVTVDIRQLGTFSNYRYIHLSLWDSADGQGYTATGSTSGAFGSFGN